MPLDFALSSRTYLVTGANSGIGLSIAFTLAAHGADWDRYRRHYDVNLAAPPLGLNRMGRVNYSKAYSSDDGTNTNFIESFFNRIQRAYVGIHHRFSTRYLDWYVADLAWKEDTRRMSNGAQT